MRFRRYAAATAAGAALLVGTAALAAFIYPRIHPVDYINERVKLDRPLIIPPFLQPEMDNGEEIFRLRIVHGQTELLPGKLANTAGFNGTFLGPTIRAHQGDHIQINVTNEWNETTTVHWHGMHLPAKTYGVDDISLIVQDVISTQPAGWSTAAPARTTFRRVGKYHSGQRHLCTVSRGSAEPHSPSIVECLQCPKVQFRFVRRP